MTIQVLADLSPTKVTFFFFYPSMLFFYSSNLIFFSILTLSLAWSSSGGRAHTRQLQSKLYLHQNKQTSQTLYRVTPTSTFYYHQPYSELKNPFFTLDANVDCCAYHYYAVNPVTFPFNFDSPGFQEFPPVLCHVHWVNVANLKPQQFTNLISIIWLTIEITVDFRKLLLALAL